jgi:lysophospholipase L1-like esterase
MTTQTPSSSSATAKSSAPFWATLGACLLAVLAMVYAFFPAPSLEAQVGETQVRFRASRGAVLFPNDCVTLSWDVFNTLGVRVNGELLPTPSEKALCVNAAVQPLLAVTLLDGTEQTFPLRVIVLGSSPLMLLLAVVGLSALGGALWAWLWRSAWVVRVRRLPTMRALVRAMAWACVGALVAWGVAEVGLRAYLGAFGTREQRIMYLYSVEDIRREESQLIHVPYVSYLPNPATRGHNALGYRGEEVRLPKPEGVFRIVALGGSTTYSTGTTAEESYPAFLQRILREDYGYTQVEVVNAGFLGYTTWEAFATFAFRALELEPDLLIYYEGVNDLSVRERSSTDCYAGENAMRGLNPVRGVFVERTGAYPPSVALRFVGVNTGLLPNPLALDSAFEPSLVACAPDAGDMTIEKRLSANTPRYFERNLRNLALLAQANGVQPVFSSWAYNVDAERPPLWREQIALQNSVLESLAQELGVPFYDLASSFPRNPAFWEADGIHMLSAGTQEQARQYAAFLVREGLVR